MDSEAAIIAMASAGLNLPEEQVRKTVALLDAGNTVPFITRYRKEQTGALDEEQIRAIQKFVGEQRELREQREKVLKAIDDQGKLTDALRAEIEAATTLKRLDELYAPYRSKRKTRADEAREMGLEPLAEAIWTGRLGDGDLPRVAANCVGKHPALTSAEVVLQRTGDIVAARIAERVDVRDIVRSTAWKTGTLDAKLNKSSKEADKFKDYDGFKQPVGKLPPHRILAVDRGEERKTLRVAVNWDHDLASLRVCSLLQLKDHRARQFMKDCVHESLKRLVNPSIEREVRRDLTERAQAHAIDVFGRNLRNLLIQPPLSRTRVLAIDPGFRTGCKIVVLDEDGRLIVEDRVLLIKPAILPEMRNKLATLIREHQCSVVAIGNGTACRETETFVAETIAEFELNCRYVIVNEAGASIYSASEVGRAEFPNLDATVRGTISIGRRLQDPLSELVKIDPQHIGVGMYQHDLPEKQLQSSLDAVVESCVNHVGVDLNRASAELLRYVSGLNRAIAKKIVAWRNEQGPFRTRQDLLSVSGVGEMTFTQAAGFLKLTHGDEPLDATWIHPESYSFARELIARFDLDPSQLLAGKIAEEPRQQLRQADVSILARDLETDPYTVTHLLESLTRPGRDPREDLPGPLFRSGVLSYDDLSPGMQLSGVVTNVVDFGCFVDVGLKNDGLVHISQMADRFISSPFDHVSVGDVVRVWVDNLDLERQRLSLTMRSPESTI